MEDDINIIKDIKLITDKISSRELCPISNLDNYSKKLDIYEDIKQKYESGDLLDISSLIEFSNQATILTNYTDNLISRFHKLNNIHNHKFLVDIHDALFKIDLFFEKLECLNNLMKNKDNSFWYKQLNDELSTIDSFMKTISNNVETTDSSSNNYINLLIFMIIIIFVVILLILLFNIT